MRKLMKLSLEEEQIKIKSLYDRFDGYEIFLYGDQRDHFELINTINKPIISIHYPIDDCDVFDVVSAYKTPYAKQVFEACIKTNAILVLHAETGLERLLTHPKLDGFCEYIKKNNIQVKIENCYRYVGAIEGLKITKYLQNKISNTQVTPLLDTCHLIMSGMSFKFKENSFYETIDNYYSNHYIIHLNDCIGSGENESGGKHGTNFYANQYLLSNILWKLHEMQKEKPDMQLDLVLEVSEVDHIYPTNADILAKNIDKFWNSFE